MRANPRLILVFTLLASIMFACGPLSETTEGLSLPTPTVEASIFAPDTATPTPEATPSPSATPTKAATHTPTSTPTIPPTPEQDEVISSDDLHAELIFTAPDAILAISGDLQGTVFLRTEQGEIWKLAPDGDSEKVYAGLAHCSFNQAVMAAIPDGAIILNDCVDDKDVLLQIDPQGNVTTLLHLGFDQNIVSIVSDIEGNVYLGTWTSQGNITLSFNPTHLGGADHILGQVWILSPDHSLEPLYEGGIPLALATADDGSLFAAIWGQSGPFKPASGDYSVCAYATLFWVGLSDQVAIQQLSGESAEQVVTDQLRAVSSIAIDSDGYTFAFGLDETGECSINNLRAGQLPSRLIFSEDEIDRYTAGLLISGPDLYFAIEDGNVYRVSDFTTTYVSTSDPAPASTQAPTATPQVIIVTEIIDQSNDVSAAHIDVIKLTYEIIGETLRAVFHLRDVPAELTFNRPGVPDNTAEYMWHIYVDIDNNRETGEQLNAIGAEYSISILHFVRESASESTAPIEDEVQVDVWEFDPTDGGWSVVSSATIEVDSELDTITLAGEIPSLTSESRIFFNTYD